MDKIKQTIQLDHGGGGLKSWELLQEIRKILDFRGDWKNCEDDGAVFPLTLPSPEGKGELIVFTTDAFIVDPIFFPGGDIGKIAICGTINDLSVMGAKPIGISLSMVIEEGFPQDDFFRILKSINEISHQAGVPVVTGDTKVMEKGKIDKIEITTSGVGLTEKVINNNGMKPGDVIIVSGDLGEHAVALLASRFNYKTEIISDCKPLNKELSEVGKYLNACKDPTRGGLAANLCEMADKSGVKVILDESKLPYKKDVIALSELLGIDIFALASEGRFIASVSSGFVEEVLAVLRKFNNSAKVIGFVESGKGVFLKTELGGLRSIEMPRRKLIPRIC